MIHNFDAELLRKFYTNWDTWFSFRICKMVTNLVHFVNSSYFIMIALNLYEKNGFNWLDKNMQSLQSLQNLVWKVYEALHSRFVKKITVHCLNFWKLKLNFEIKLNFLFFKLDISKLKKIRVTLDISQIECKETGGEIYLLHRELP